jgi:hypothetical protein
MQELDVSDQTKRELDLSPQKLFYAVKSRYPHLSAEDTAAIVNVLLDAIAQHITANDTFAFLRYLEDGSAEVITYGLEQLPRSTE